MKPECRLGRYLLWSHIPTSRRSPEVFRTEAVKIVYESYVRRRLSSQWWSVPSAWKQHLAAVAQNAQAVQAPIKLFVKATFDTLDSKICRKYFGMKYPPIQCLTTQKARMRYRSWEAKRAKKPKTVCLSKRHIKKAERWLLADRSDEDIILAVANGTIHAHAVRKIADQRGDTRLIGLLDI